MAASNETKVMIIKEAGGVEPKPESHIIFTSLTCLFCNPILGYVALLFSCLSEYAYSRGRMNDAFRYGGRAQYWAMIAMCCGITMLLVIFMILYIHESATWTGQGE